MIATSSLGLQKGRYSIASKGIRFVGFLGVAMLVALLSYRFFFPGYLRPFAIYHDDHFLYQGLGARGYGFLVYFQRYPRPISYVLVDLCGRLGPYWVLAPVFFCSFLNAALAVTYIERLQDRRIGIAVFALFSALCFGNPEFYVHIKADPFSVFALAFLLITFHCWQTFAESGKLLWLLLTGTTIVLFSLTKESYFGPLGLFFTIQTIVIKPRRIASAMMLVWCAICMGYALHRDSTAWVLSTGSSARGAYSANLNPASLFQGVVTLASGVLYPVVILMLAAILAVAWFRSRQAFVIASTSVLLGIVALLPNATLPHHLEPQYSCLCIYFLFVPVLLAPQLLPSRPMWVAGMVCCGALFYVLTLSAYANSIAGDAGWVRQQERSGMKLLAGFERMRSITKPGEASLVSGITLTYNPFRTPSFISGFFGHTKFWTVVVPDNILESIDETTRTIHASNPARFQAYTHSFTFSDDGTLETVAAQPVPPLSWGQVAPFGAVRFFATPNPVPAAVQGLPHVTLTWSTPVRLVEIRIGAPNGKLFAGGNASGQAITGNWVTPDMQFYLQDAEWGRSTDPDNTLAKLRIRFSR